jgi:hypothetical protein
MVAKPFPALPKVSDGRNRVMAVTARSIPLLPRRLNELTMPVKQRQNCEMKILATRNLLTTALVDGLAGMMSSLKPTGFGNP